MRQNYFVRAVGWLFIWLFVMFLLLCANVLVAFVFSIFFPINMRGVLHFMQNPVYLQSLGFCSALVVFLAEWVFRLQKDCDLLQNDHNLLMDFLWHMGRDAMSKGLLAKQRQHEDSFVEESTLRAFLVGHYNFCPEAHALLRVARDKTRKEKKELKEFTSIAHKVVVRGRKRDG